MGTYGTNIVHARRRLACVASTNLQPFSVDDGALPRSTAMFRTGILFPLGLGFGAFGLYEYNRDGFNEHVALLFFFFGLNTLYTLVRAMKSAGR
jgi:hypothetical protein